MFKDRTEAHYLKTGRIVSVFIVIGGVLFAYQLPGVVKGLEIFWKIGPMLGIGFWLGLFWRGMTPAGVWTATLVGFLSWWLSEQAFFIEMVASFNLAKTLNMITGTDSMAISLPWQMVFYLTLGIIAGIAVSLFTREVDEDKLNDFYNLVKTPVRENEGVPDKSCSLPQGVSPAEKARIFPGVRGLEIYVPSKVSIIGFGITVLAVLLLIFAFIYITQ
jgi:Na+/proline symporter